ncbi:MAG: enoyl-CoA hydratase/isomerase family protein [Myxococcota bacterium]|nr:enoyl-CoA hydratase/isomerase family protein [Myxococcota bacterium]
MIDHKRDGAIHIVTMNSGANVINPDWQARMLEILDGVENDCDGDAGLVLMGEGKFFSNGLDVPVVMSLQGDEMASFGTRMGQIMGRLTLLPMPSVAAVNGHAFAAGAFLALACDYRLMREDRGWISVSEVDAGVPIGAPMMDLLREKLPPATVRDAVLTGKRYAADEAILAGFADGKASEGDLLAEARKWAETMATTERRIFKTLKRTLYAQVGAGLGVGR